MLQIQLTFLELLHDFALEVLAGLPLGLEVDEHPCDTRVATVGRILYLFVEYFLFNFLQFTTLLNHIQCLRRGFDSEQLGPFQLIIAPLMLLYHAAQLVQMTVVL